MKEPSVNYLQEKIQLKGPSLLIYGLILIIVYKVWKVTIYNWFIQDLDYIIRYNSFELAKTLYRILATIIGMLLIKKYFINYKLEYFKDNFKITFISIFVILPLFFFSKIWMFDFSFYSNQFYKELLFNFFTGTFEEITFRGLILVGLAQYFKPILSILLSSLLFSIWHYDVVNNYISYIVIFIWGIYIGLCYLRGNSLLSLILFHFLWDQIVFGLSWTASDLYSENFVSLIESLIMAPFIWLLWRGKYFLRKE